MQENGDELDERDIDGIWGKKHEETITRQVKKAKNYYDNKKIKETPIQLLEVALSKLNHEAMEPNAIEIAEISKALKICHQIKKRVDELSNEFFQCEKKFKKLIKNKK